MPRRLSLFSLRRQPHGQIPPATAWFAWMVGTSNAYASKKLLFFCNVCFHFWCCLYCCCNCIHVDTTWCRVCRFPLLAAHQQVSEDARWFLLIFTDGGRNQRVFPALTQLWKCFINPICLTGSVTVARKNGWELCTHTCSTPKPTQTGTATVQMGWGAHASIHSPPSACIIYSAARLQMKRLSGSDWIW